VSSFGCQGGFFPGARHGFLFFTDSCGGFKSDADNNIFTVTDSPLDTPRTIARGANFPVIIDKILVIVFAAG